MSLEEHGLAHPTEALLDFFVVFSQFEYALKRAGYVKPSTDEVGSRRPVVNWSRFRHRVNQSGGIRGSRGSDLDEAIDALLDDPPKVQRLADNGRTIEWHDLGFRDDDTELWRLTRIVQTVRNNLFHGGKYPYMNVPEVARNTRLLEHSMTVVEALIACDPDVASHYDEAARAWQQPVD